MEGVRTRRIQCRWTKPSRIAYGVWQHHYPGQCSPAKRFWKSYLEILAFRSECGESRSHVRNSADHPEDTGRHEHRMERAGKPRIPDRGTEPSGTARGVC